MIDLKSIAQQLVAEGLDWCEYGSLDRVLMVERDDSGHTEVWVIDADSQNKIYRVL